MPTGSDYEDVKLGKNNSVTRQEENYGVSGDYGQVSNAPSAPEVSPESYPSPFGYGYYGNNRQFSSDKSDTPDSMAAETSASQGGFAELQNFLMNNLPTAGSRVCHPASEAWTPPHPEKSGSGDGKTGL